MMKKIFVGIIGFIACAFILNEAWAAVPQGPSIVKVEGSRLNVRNRLPDGSLANPVAYVIKGVTWQPATRPGATGPNPFDPSNPNANIPYGFFYDCKDASGKIIYCNPNVPIHGHDLLIYWQKNQLLANYLKDIGLMKAMKVNTVRVYLDFYNDIGSSPQIYTQILDEFYNKGIMVIMTVVNSKEEIDSGRYLTVVGKFKNHPAILMWSLGNEWNLDYNKYYGYATVTEAAAATNQMAQKIRAADPNHPVASCLGDRFTDANPANIISAVVSACPYVDLWGINVYRGSSFGDLFSQWNSTKPFYITEFGTDSYWSTTYKIINGNQASNCSGSLDQLTQKNIDIALWNEIKNHLSVLYADGKCLGGLTHEFNDELWKVGSYHAGLGGLDSDNTYNDYDEEGFYLLGGHPDNVANEEYFGVVTADRVVKLVYENLKAVWPDFTAPPTPIVKDEGGVTTKKNQLYASWICFDQETGIAEYQYRITRDSTSGTVVRDWTSTGTTNSVTATGLSLTEGKTYYFSVKAKNGEGLWSQIGYSDGIRVDCTPAVGSISPATGVSSPDQFVTFTTTYSDPDGWQDIQYLFFLTNVSLGTSSCFVGYYNQNVNKLYLFDDSGMSMLGGYAPGSSYVIKNSFAKLDCASTTVSGSGTTLTIKWRVSFKSTFKGMKNTYLYVRDDYNLDSGWAQKGTWAITLPPVAKIEYICFPRYTFFPIYKITGYIYNFKGDKSYDPDGSIASYLWNSGDGRTSTLANPTWIYFCAFLIPKTYTVTLTVKDDKGATATAKVTITIPALRQ